MLTRYRLWYKRDMSKSEELELFDFLSRTKLREWIDNELDSEFQVLTQAVDIDWLRRSQGRAGLLATMKTLLDKAPAAVKR